MKSLFFNSIDGDRKYNANDFTRYFSSILSNGVFLNGDNNFKVSVGSGMNITVNKGFGNINGNLFFEDAPTTLEIPTNHVQKYYIVVVRLDYLQREVTITYKETQDINNLQRDEGAYELCLALISVPPSEINILDENITDTRPNAKVCGFVNSLITVDGEELFSQFESEFNNWFDGVKGVFGEDVAGNLLNLINSNKDEISKIKNSFGKAGGVATLNSDGFIDEEHIQKQTIKLLNSSDVGTKTLELNGLNFGQASKNKVVNLYTSASSSASNFKITSNGEIILNERVESSSFAYVHIIIIINNSGEVLYRMHFDSKDRNPFKKTSKAISSENISISYDKTFKYDILEV